MARFAIDIPMDVWTTMLDHVQAISPEEGCGILGGRGDRAHLAIPVENELHSATRFRMAPAAQIEVMFSLDQLGLDLIAIYHSHPSGPAEPSPTDLAEAAYPEAAYLIWCPSPEWTCRGFDLSGTEPRPILVRRLAANDEGWFSR
jgi:proteasome lid subunit RPN8/RPN11